MKNNQIWKTEAELIRFALIIIFVSICFLILTHLVNVIFEAQWLQFSAYRFCMTSKSSDFVRRPSALTFLTIGSRMIFLICTLIFDIRTLLMVKKWKRESSQVQGEQRHIMNEIPMISTLLNALLLFIPFLSTFLANTLCREYFRQNIILVQLSFDLSKSPIILCLTNYVVSSNVASDEVEERERKRNIEIQDAIKRRNDRLARRLAMQDEGMSFKDIAMLFAS